MPKPSSLPSRSLTLVWLALVVATLAGWQLGESAQHAHGPARAAVAGVVAIAFLKVLAVGLQFMELREAVWFLRAGFCVWVFGAMTALIAILVLR
ncbi:cytochrome C oxidase subunit IV family protein [Novosphingobium colocasiae]|uniref:Cytochrome c oxidase subunit IV n=1 Tax=Novosphingobium colocasiae TaxID=1256513 RepID=A0A918P953_9SPHN|nr:cytochrome C oxidase subunit IV family protein [Novosphingobium colocasiae]GGY90009.1 hypothetical protein GCM10011614_00720 [Novosphingobium colocasiae]